MGDRDADDRVLKKIKLHRFKMLNSKCPEPDEKALTEKSSIQLDGSLKAQSGRLGNLRDAARGNSTQSSKAELNQVDIQKNAKSRFKKDHGGKIKIKVTGSKSQTQVPLGDLKACSSTSNQESLDQSGTSTPQTPSSRRVLKSNYVS